MLVSVSAKRAECEAHQTSGLAGSLSAYVLWRGHPLGEAASALSLKVSGAAAKRLKQADVSQVHINNGCRVGIKKASRRSREAPLGEFSV